MVLQIHLVCIPSHGILIQIFHLVSTMYLFLHQLMAMNRLHLAGSFQVQRQLLVEASLLKRLVMPGDQQTIDVKVVDANTKELVSGANVMAQLEKKMNTTGLQIYQVHILILGTSLLILHLVTTMYLFLHQPMAMYLPHLQEVFKFKDSC